MDYKELIEKLRGVFAARPGIYLAYVCCEEAATAIETLLAERDAAVADMRRMGCKKCDVCKYAGSKGSDKSPCKHCCHSGGFDDCFEWRGPRKEPTP